MSKDGIGRRAFVARASLAAAGLTLGGRAAGQMSGGGGGMGGGGTAVVGPPVGSLLQEPVVARNDSTTPGVVDVSIDARIAPATVNGASASLLAYNGSFIARERVDLLVKASGTRGDYKLLALPYARRGSMASAQVTLMTLRVNSTASSQQLPPRIYAVDDPQAPTRLADDATLPRPRFELGMGQMRGYINGKTFQILADGSISSDMRHSVVGTDEIWEIVNNSGMDHPWHPHVNDGQVLAVSGGDATFARYAQLYTAIPAFKDTIIVPKWGSSPCASRSGISRGRRCTTDTSSSTRTSA